MPDYAIERLRDEHQQLRALVSRMRAARKPAELLKRLEVEAGLAEGRYLEAKGAST